MTPGSSDASLEARVMETMAARERSIPLNDMMARLGVALSADNLPRLGLRYPTALHRCEACPAKGACREWLASGVAPASFAPRFCANADILFELQCDQPGAHPNARSMAV
jgi:hypothetical protein